MNSRSICQSTQLQAAGCAPDHIYADKEGVGLESGTGTPKPRSGTSRRAGGRPAVIWRLDRLGRSLQGPSSRWQTRTARHQTGVVALLQRHPHPGRQGAVPDLRHVRRVRAQPDRGAYEGRTDGHARPRPQTQDDPGAIRPGSQPDSNYCGTKRPESRAKRTQGGNRPKYLPDGAYRPLIAAVQKDAIRQRPGHEVLQLDGRSRTSEP